MCMAVHNWKGNDQETVLYTGMYRCGWRMQCLHSSQSGRKNRGRSQCYHRVHLFKSFLVFIRTGIQNFLPQTPGELRLTCLKTCSSASLSDEELQLSILKKFYFFNHRKFDIIPKAISWPSPFWIVFPGSNHSKCSVSWKEISPGT